MSESIIFENHSITVHHINGQPYLKGTDIAKALGYTSGYAVSDLYNRHKAEFTEEMSQTVKLTVSSNLTRKARVFDREGAWLIAMLSKTPKAAEFRKWVMKVLREHVDTQKSPTAELPQNITSTLKSVLHANEVAMKKRETSNHLQQASEDMAKDYAEDAGSLKVMRENLELEITNILIMNSVQIEILLEGGSSFDQNPSMHDFLERTSGHLSRN
jgi:prophage antirepressor-like protein